MSQEDAAEFSRAVNLAQSNNKVAAYAILKRLSSKYPDNLMATLWLAFTTPDLSEAEWAIQMAERQNPADPNVGAAKQWLQQEKQKAPAQVRPVATVPAVEYRPAPVVTTPVPAVDFAPAPTPMTAAAATPSQSSLGYQVVTHEPKTEFKRPSEILKMEEAQTASAAKSWDNPVQPDMPTLRDALVKGKRQRKPLTLNTLTVLAGVLVVLVIALIGCGIYFFILNPSSVLSDTAFDKAGLSNFSGLEKLDPPQSIKDQMASYLSNPQIAQSGIKVVQMDYFKIKTTSSDADFTKFYQDELTKGGWKTSTIPLATVSKQPFLTGEKGNTFIFIGTTVPSRSGSELSSQVAPNQSVAIAMLFEKS